MDIDKSIDDGLTVGWRLREVRKDDWEVVGTDVLRVCERVHIIDLYVNVWICEQLTSDLSRSTLLVNSRPTW